jgi:hypothetical protein
LGANISHGNAIQKKAIDLADDQAKKEYEKLLDGYKEKKPWRE